MKISITSLLLLILPIMNKINSQTIVYTESISIDKDAFKSEPEIQDFDDSNEGNSVLNELTLEADDLIDNLTEKENQPTYFYTIGNDQIRYRRNLIKTSSIFNEEWITIDRDSRIMNHYYIDEAKGPQLTQFPFDRSTFRDIVVSYETKIDNNDQKIILGYKCHRVIITETIKDAEYETEIKIYDMYVTNEIDLPFHLLNSTLKPTIDSCPLQLTTYIKDKGNSYSTKKAIEIRLGNKCDDVKLPERFKIK